MKGYQGLSCWTINKLKADQAIFTCVWMYLVCAQVHLCTDTPFWPPADNNAMGAHCGEQKTILKTVRETLPEEMKSVLQCPLPPTVFSLTEDSDKEEKKSSNTWQARSFLLWNPVTPSLTLSQTFVFGTESTMKAKELSHWLLGCTAEAAISRSSNWITNQKGATEQQLRCGFTILLEYSHELGKRKSLTGFRKSDNHNPDSRKAAVRWEVQGVQSI